VSLAPEQRLRILGRAATVLASSLEFEATLGNVIDVCIPALGDFGFFDVVTDEGEVRRTARAHDDPATAARLAQTRWERQPRTEMNLCALSTGRSAIHPDVDAAWLARAAASPAQLEALRALSFRSMITVPVACGGELLGALTLFYGSSGRGHTDEDVTFAEELAALAAQAVANARLFARQRRTEAALRDSDARLRLALDAANTGVWDWDVVADRVTWTEQLYALHGLPAGAFGGRARDFHALVHPEDRARVAAAIERSLSTGEPYEIEFRTVRPDGAVRWLLTRATVFRDEAGRARRMLGATADITERRELMARTELLSRAGERFARSLDEQETLRAVATLVVPAIADCCCIDLIDAGGALRHALTYHRDPARARAAEAHSARWLALTDWSGSAAQVARTGRPALVSQIDAAPPAGSAADAEALAFLRSLGVRSYLAVPLIGRGRTLGVVTALTTEPARPRFGTPQLPLFEEVARRAALAIDNARLYTEAAQARREAETASRAKDEFLAMLGHELRNPLAPIVTAIDLLAARGDIETARVRQVLARQVTHLERLVDDLLDVARVVRGQVALRRERLDVSVIIDDALEIARPLIDQRGLTLRVERPPEELAIDGDRVRLTQVVTNLLTNAAKYTDPPGTIAVSARAVGDAVELRVRDTGAGVEPELLGRIFELFVQGPRPLDRAGGGLGLGLAIVKNLVELHGGRVAASSEGPGRGTEVCVTLSRAASPPAAAEARVPALPAASTPSEAAHRILVVDDNRDAADLLVELLSLHGYDARAVYHGRDALRLAAELRPHVALLDIGLPEMDGYELAARLRAEAKPGPPLYLVALTGYGGEHDRKRSEQAGFARHLVKPVSPSQLVETIEALTRPEGPS
jgi:PAS domain S-box-containing protein